MPRHFFRPLLSHRLARPAFYLVALAIIVPLAWQSWQRNLPYNGFDLDELTVPKEAIVGGGPGRDDIPALTDPETVSIAESDYAADQPVLAISINGEARAYPVTVLNWHEVVNDQLGGAFITVTWCPLCHTGVIYRGRHEGERVTFGVSGLLYRQNLLMYDHATESLWSQLSGEAISGSRRGTRLEALPFKQTTVGKWRERHPGASILSHATGYDRDYSVDPYSAYHREKGGSEAFADRELVVGVALDGEARAYPLRELARLGEKGSVTDTLAGRSYTLEYDTSLNTFSVDMHNAGKQPRTTLSYRFAWKSFHPDSRFFEAGTR